jgi:rhamnogalacturonyl hydrolase YesR
MPSRISETIKSYIAGFLDGDGCIMYQLIRRKDYRYGFEIRASIVFYQKTQNEKYLKQLKNFLKIGYLRKRKDGMTEYTIVGLKPVMEILKLVEPYCKIKKTHIKLAKKINRLLEGKFDLKKFIKASELVDKFQQLNYSKKRKITSKTLKEYLEKHKLYPRND